MAERVALTSYAFSSLFVGLLIYPVFGHWALAGVDKGQTNGWLNDMGFVDFAGSSIVHSTAGWVALALNLVLMLGFTVGIAILAHPLAGLYSDDVAVRALTAAGLYVVAVMVIVDGAQAVLATSLRAAGDVKVPPGAVVPVAFELRGFSARQRGPQRHELDIGM